MPLIRYHCSKCGHKFELMRPQSKIGDVAACPQCGHEVSGSASLPGTAQPGHDTLEARELPPWVRGQVEAQVRQLIAGGDAVAGHEVELVTQEVLKELSHASAAEITPGSIRILAQKHLAGLDSWARSARRRNAQLDAADKLDEED